MMPRNCPRNGQYSLVVLRVTAALVCAAAFAAVTPPLALPGPPLELPALTRIASKLSGLTFKRQVKVVVTTAVTMREQTLTALDREYPADQQAYDETLYRALGLLGQRESLHAILVEQQTQGVLGLYDPVTKTAYARKGSQLRSTIVHELVHALQDQAFDLGRLSALRRGNRDAAYAASAAVEGHATFATQVLGDRVLALTDGSVGGVRLLASHTGSRIRLFLGLEREFPYSTGLRFVSTLHNLGGREAVFGSLRRFPTTTEQIFHIDAFLSREPALPIELPASSGGFALVRDDTFGELDVRALLAVFQIPRLDHVGDGWGGGLSAIYRDPSGAQAVAIRLDWDSALDASQWAEAVATYVNEAFDADIPGFPPTTKCTVDSCWAIAGRSIAFRQSGSHTALVFGPSIAAAASLADGLVPGA